MCTLHMMHEIALEDSADRPPLTIFCVHHSHGGCPILALQGWAAMLRVLFDFVVGT